MKQLIILREYLRTCRRVRLHPSADGLKKIEYLRFMGAHLCPDCSEEVDAEAYSIRRNEDGLLTESFRCRYCGSEFVFPQEAVH